jgi:membrane protein implicated in regulation of membrane protease activity
MDYRQASIDNAQGAIKAAMLLNGGAAVALLTQIGTLPAGLKGAVLWSMTFWAVGVSSAAIAWLFAFAATRYVDKWQTESNDAHRVTSNSFQLAGVLAVLFSIAMFLAGCLYFAFGYAAA